MMDAVKNPDNGLSGFSLTHPWAVWSILDGTVFSTQEARVVLRADTGHGETLVATRILITKLMAVATHKHYYINGLGDRETLVASPARPQDAEQVQTAQQAAEIVLSLTRAAQFDNARVAAFEEQSHNISVERETWPEDIVNAAFSLLELSARC